MNGAARERLLIHADYLDRQGRRTLADDLRSALVLGLPDAPAVPPAVRPRWDYLSRATGALRSLLDKPSELAHADALAAYVRDTFDALGLSIRDESTLYVLFVTVSLMVECANNGREKGIVTDDDVISIARIAQSIAASLLPYLPEEAFARG